MTTVSRPDGQQLQFNYDAAKGRLNTLTTPDGNTVYGYDAATGKLNSITVPGGEKLAYAYTGALLAETAWTGDIAGNVGYGYDNDFRVTTVSLNGANSIAYQYDNDGLLTQAGGLTLNRNAQNGLLTGTTLGSVSDSLSYDGFGEVTDYTAKYSGNVLFSTQYTYDKLGRITRKVETVQGETDTYVYSYDLAGRLERVKLNGVTISVYSYDTNGNRLSYTAGGATVNGSYDAQDRLLTYGGNAYTYTANGELKTKTAGGHETVYRYDVLGNLKQVKLPDGKQIDYLVDARNRRIGKKVDGVLKQGFLWQDQLKPIAELDGSGAVVSRFVYATGVNVPDYMIRDGNTYCIVTDHLGSPRLVVNVANGAIVQEMNYDEFGNVLSDTNPGFQPFGFAGGIYDRDTGLVRFGARDYDAETGRWTRRDPMKFQGVEHNLYAYTLNDPVNRVDQFGLYASFDEALRAAFAETWPLSNFIDLEFGGVIYKNLDTGSYEYTVNVGGPKGVDVDPNPMCDPNIQRFATYHTHGRYNPPSPDFFKNLRYDMNENLSQNDIDNAKKRELPGYLITPSGVGFVALPNGNVEPWNW